MKNFIVGGPSRNGKTTLVNVVNRQKGDIAGLPVEGQLERFYCRFYPFFNSNKRAVIEDYALLPRYTDEKRLEKHSPAEFISTPLDLLCSEISGKAHHIGLIFDFLSTFARDNGASSWIVCDLHPERFFEFYKQHCPELHLIIMMRDPRESLCANLYWRTYPERRKYPKPLIEYYTLLWAFSARNYVYWKTKYPDDVSIFSFNDLLDENSAASGRFSQLLKIQPGAFSAFFPTTPSFSFNDGKHYAPDGEWKELMSEDEIFFIEGQLKESSDECGLNFQFGKNSASVVSESSEFLKKKQQMLVICDESPILAKRFIERVNARNMFDYYITRIKRAINEIKRIAVFLLGTCFKRCDKNV